MYQVLTTKIKEMLMTAIYHIKEMMPKEAN